MFKIYNARDRLWQWDAGQRLIVDDGLPCSEVHFCNGTSDCSLVCEIYEEDGLRLVDVPNILLQTAKTIKAFAYVCDGDDHHTQVSKYFTVTPRSKPADYVYTETEVKTFEKLEKKIDTLLNAVKAWVSGEYRKTSDGEILDLLIEEDALLAVRDSDGSILALDGDILIW